MSVQRSGKRAEPFFFGMELVGPGLDIQSPAEVKAKAKKAAEKQNGSPEKKKKLPDPISESINERKDYGSYLSVVKGTSNRNEVENMQLSLSGKGIPDSHLKMAV